MPPNECLIVDYDKALEEVSELLCVSDDDKEVTTLQRKEEILKEFDEFDAKISSEFEEEEEAESEEEMYIEDTPQPLIRNGVPINNRAKQFTTALDKGWRLMSLFVEDVAYSLTQAGRMSFKESVKWSDQVLKVSDRLREQARGHMPPLSVPRILEFSLACLALTMKYSMVELPEEQLVQKILELGRRRDYCDRYLFQNPNDYGRMECCIMRAVNYNLFTSLDRFKRTENVKQFMDDSVYARNHHRWVFDESQQKYIFQ